MSKKDDHKLIKPDKEGFPNYSVSKETKENTTKLTLLDVDISHKKLKGDSWCYAFQYLNEYTSSLKFVNDLALIGCHFSDPDPNSGFGGFYDFMYDLTHRATAGMNNREFGTREIETLTLDMRYSGGNLLTEIHKWLPRFSGLRSLNIFMQDFTVAGLEEQICEGIANTSKLRSLTINLTTPIYEDTLQNIAKIFDKQKKISDFTLNINTWTLKDEDVKRLIGNVVNREGSLAYKDTEDKIRADQIHDLSGLFQYLLDKDVYARLDFDSSFTYYPQSRQTEKSQREYFSNIKPEYRPEMAKKFMFVAEDIQTKKSAFLDKKFVSIMNEFKLNERSLSTEFEIDVQNFLLYGLSKILGSSEYTDIQGLANRHDAYINLLLTYGNKLVLSYQEDKANTHLLKLGAVFFNHVNFLIENLKKPGATSENYYSKQAKEWLKDAENAYQKILDELNIKKGTQTENEITKMAKQLFMTLWTETSSEEVAGDFYILKAVKESGIYFDETTEITRERIREKEQTPKQKDPEMVKSESAKELQPPKNMKKAKKEKGMPKRVTPDWKQIKARRKEQEQRKAEEARRKEREQELNRDQIAIDEPDTESSTESRASKKETIKSEEDLDHSTEEIEPVKFESHAMLKLQKHAMTLEKIVHKDSAQDKTVAIREFIENFNAKPTLEEKLAYVEEQLHRKIPSPENAAPEVNPLLVNRGTGFYQFKNVFFPKKHFNSIDERKHLSKSVTEDAMLELRLELMQKIDDEEALSI